MPPNNGKSRTEAQPVLKVLILGDGAVGKSCIMTRFINNQFEENSFHTIGVEFLNKDFAFHGKNYTLQVNHLQFLKIVSMCKTSVVITFPLFILNRSGIQLDKSGLNHYAHLSTEELTSVCWFSP
jgi:GTPase SAR1 family protein